MGIELLFLARTQPLSPRVHYKKNQIERVYTKGDIIHDRSRSTGFRIFNLACNHTMDRIAFCRKVYFGLFFSIMYFRRYFERSGGVLIKRGRKTPAALRIEERFCRKYKRSTAPLLSIRSRTRRWDFTQPLWY